MVRYMMVFPPVRQTQSDRWLLQIQKMKVFPCIDIPFFAVVGPEVQAPTFRGCYSPARFLTNILHLASKNGWYGYNPETAIRVRLMINHQILGVPYFEQYPEASRLQWLHLPKGDWCRLFHLLSMVDGIDPIKGGNGTTSAHG